MLHDDGSWLTIEIDGTNLLDDPAIGGFVVTCRDITDRQQAEAELREAQERFRSAFDHAPIGMALIAPGGHCFQANRAFAQMLGRAEDDLVGVAVGAITDPSDRADVVTTMQRAISGADGSYRIEQRFLHADGRPVWVTHSGSVVRGLTGEPLYFVCQIEDITERRARGELSRTRRSTTRSPGFPTGSSSWTGSGARSRSPTPSAGSRSCSSTSTTSRW